MQVNLSAHELDMLDKALVAYQNEPGSRGMATMMIGAMLSKDSDEERTKKLDAESNRVREETRQRERQCLMLRAKLMQCVTIDSEHTLTTG
jgi:hypothetical protein